MNDLIVTLYTNILEFKKRIINYFNFKDLKFYNVLFFASTCSLSVIFLLNGDNSDCLMIKDVLYPAFDKTMNTALKKHFDECSQLESYFTKFEATQVTWVTIFEHFLNCTYVFEIEEELFYEFIRKKKK